MSRLTKWSFAQFNQLKNLHKASNFANNSNIKLFSNSAIISLVHINYEEPIMIYSSLNQISKNKNCNYANKNPQFNLDHGAANSCCINNINPIQLLNQKNEDNIKNINQNQKIEKKSQKISLNFHINNIYIPFFHDGISISKFIGKGKYFIVGNKNSQLFYIYENFPATNLKHNYDISPRHSAFQNKISYSVFRGVTKGVINNIDLSPCKKFLTISSNKGTFHLFSIPEKNEQINENSSLFNYEFYDEENNKIINAKNIEKIKYSGFIDNCVNYTFKTSSKLLSNFRIDLDTIDNDIKKNIVKTNLQKTLNANLLLNFSEYNSAISVHLIHSEAYSSNSSDDRELYSSFITEMTSFNQHNNPRKNSGYNGSRNENSEFHNLNSFLYKKVISNNKSNSFSNRSSSNNHKTKSFNFDKRKEIIYQIKKIDLNDSLLRINIHNTSTTFSSFRHSDAHMTTTLDDPNYISEKIKEINLNYKNLLHKIKLNYFKVRTNLKQFIDWETTTKNIPTLQLHPLFSFNYYKKNSGYYSNTNNSNTGNNRSLHCHNPNNNNLFLQRNSKNTQNANNISLFENKNSGNIHKNGINLSNSNNSVSNTTSANNINGSLDNKKNVANTNNQEKKFSQENDVSNKNLNLEMIIYSNDDKMENLDFNKNNIFSKQKIKNSTIIYNKDTLINRNIIKREKFTKLKAKSKENNKEKPNNIKENKRKSINLKYKKYEKDISINSSSYSLGSSLEKNKLKIFIEHDAQVLCKEYEQYVFFYNILS